MDSTVKKGRGEFFTLTDMLDQVFLNKYLGIPIFLTILWTMFQFAFAVSEPFVVIIEKVFEMLGAWVNQAISDPHLASFVSLGIFGGLGSVLVFIPPIFGLFLALSILEDSGYMARAAFVMDRFMYRLGLHGRSFIPLMIGFGCNVPAIMAARSMDNEKDRMITMLISPLISCSARLPVYVLIAEHSMVRPMLGLQSLPFMHWELSWRSLWPFCFEGLSSKESHRPLFWSCRLMPFRTRGAHSFICGPEANRF